MSRVVVGTAAFGLPYGLGRDGHTRTLDREETRALVEEALAAGVSTFDTAPAYGESEARLGETLGARGVVWTKVGRNDTGVGAEIEASLARLRRERLELVQWHNWRRDLLSDARFLRAWEAKDARVLARGATTYGATDALAAVESGLFSVVQVEFNLLNRSVIDTIAASAAARGVDIAVRSVLLQGALTDDARDLPALSELREAVARARALAHRHDLRLEQLALAAAFVEPAIRWVLVGVDRCGQLAEALACESLLHVPSTEELRALDLRGHPATDPRTWSRA